MDSELSKRIKNLTSQARDVFLLAQELPEIQQMLLVSHLNYSILNKLSGRKENISCIVRDFVNVPKERLKELQEAADKAFKTHYQNNTFQKSRSRAAILSRRFVATQLYKDGHNYVKISKALGLSWQTVYSGIDKTFDMIEYPRQFADEYLVWLTFKNMIGG